MSSRYIDNRSDPYVKFTASGKPADKVFSNESGTKNIIQMDRRVKDNWRRVKGFLISPYSELSYSKKEGSDISSAEKNIGLTTQFTITQEKTDYKGKIDIPNANTNHGFDFYPKLEIPATEDNFYMLKLKKADYISRIVVECSIQDVHTQPQEFNTNAIYNLSTGLTENENKQYIFDSTINYHLQDNFDKVTMNLYDEKVTKNY